MSMRIASFVALVGLGLVGCGGTLVPAQPRMVQLGSQYDASAVRDAVARAMNRRKMRVFVDDGQRLVASDTRGGRNCVHAVTYTDHNVLIATSPPEGVAPGQQAVVDSRCLDEGEVLAKVVRKEVERPARLAARRLRVAAGWAPAAGPVAEPAVDSGAVAEPAPAPAPSVEPVYSAPAPAPQPVYVAAPPPAPVFVQRNVQHNSNVSVNNSVSYHHTVVQNSAPPPPPPIKQGLCCVNGQGYVCPNASIFVAMCVTKKAEIPRSCQLDPTQARYCR